MQWTLLVTANFLAFNFVIAGLLLDNNLSEVQVAERDRACIFKETPNIKEHFFSDHSRFKIEVDHLEHFFTKQRDIKGFLEFKKFLKYHLNDQINNRLESQIDRYLNSQIE
jgi:hypothetical protein